MSLRKARCNGHIAITSKAVWHLILVSRRCLAEDRRMQMPHLSDPLPEKRLIAQ